MHRHHLPADGTVLFHTRTVETFLYVGVRNLGAADVTETAFRVLDTTHLQEAWVRPRNLEPAATFVRKGLEGRFGEQVKNLVVAAQAELATEHEPEGNLVEVALAVVRGYRVAAGL